MELDIWTVAVAYSSFASLRFPVAEIADEAMTTPGAATRRDLLQALADAERA
jgi:hypothetical protein